MGVDTLREFSDEILWPLGLYDYVGYSYENLPFLSGSEGNKERAVARVSLPIGVDGEVWVWDADLTKGGCPGLLSNQSFLRLRLTLIANFFENGDGVLASCSTGKAPTKVWRVILTDSGHYMLPIDQFPQKLQKGRVSFSCSHLAKVSDEDRERACKHIGNIHSAAKARWNDISYPAPTKAYTASTTQTDSLTKATDMSAQTQ